MQKILELRRKNPLYGKAKITVLLKRDHGINLPESTVGRIIAYYIKRGQIKPACLYYKKKRIRPREFNKHPQRFQGICAVTKMLVEQAYSKATSDIARRFLEFIRTTSNDIKKVKFIISCIKFLKFRFLGLYMKKQTQFFLALFLLCSNNVVSINFEDTSIQNIYTQRAKEFLKVLSVEEPAVTLNQDDLIEYLNHRVTAAEGLLSGQKSLQEKEMKTLNPDWCFLFVLNRLDTNPNARVCYFYPKMAQENVAYMLRKKLQCRLSDQVADFEEPYKDTLKKISKDEYVQKLSAFSEDQINEILIQGSKCFAQAILDLINQKSSI